MKSKGIAIFATMMAALMLVGASYALWSEQLFIRGTVETGEVKVIIECARQWEIEEKDWVSGQDCYIDGNTLVINIYNAYPCIWYYTTVMVTNVGTIPVDLAAFVADPGTLPSGATFDLSGVPDLGCQLHKGESVEITIGVHLDNSAEELATYGFSIMMDWWQYNEYP